MKNTFSIIILLLFLNCKSDKKEIPPEFIDYDLNYIEFLDKEVYLPKDFKKTTLETVVELIKDSKDSSALTEYEYNKLQGFKSMGKTVEMFIKDDNYKNNISFQSGEYLKLNKKTVNVYVELLENQIFTNSPQIERKRLESKFLTYGAARIIKVKYLQTHGDEKLYLTQYLVDYRLQTFGIIVIGESNTDYQNILKNFKK